VGMAKGIVVIEIFIFLDRGCCHRDDSVHIQNPGEIK